MRTKQINKTGTCWRQLALTLAALSLALCLQAQDIPQHISYTQIYDFIDELAAEHIIEINSAVKPYSRNLIAQKLQEAQLQREHLTRRQQADLDFFLNDYALECDTIPDAIVQWTNRTNFSLGLLQPAFHYKDRLFKCRITPLLGMHVYANRKGAILKRWWGASFQADIASHVSVWGDLRDQSYNGTALLRDSYYETNNAKIQGARLSQPQYLNMLPGCEYKEASYGGDFSDSRGGIKAYTSWGSIGLVKDNIVWGDAYHCSNILSGRAPSFPMVTLQLKPVKWFELNYFHAWLISNVLDSTRQYTANAGTEYEKIYYRPANKFMAANMLTFRPIPYLNLSVGNSIIYAENNVQAAYFIPIAFYKSLDHLLTKGLAVENQNSQVFFSLSTRNVKYLNLYASVYVDEIKFARFKKSNPENNPISWQAGFSLTNFPMKNLSLRGEYTRTNILNYKHFINTLNYASNDYNLGHYMGDNAQEIYLELQYKPIRSLNLKLWWCHATKGNDYEDVRTRIDGQSTVSQIISQPVLGEKVWQNNTVAFDAVYEVFNNCYAVLNVAWNNAQAFEPASEPIVGENRLTAQGYLDKFTPVFYQGRNLTITAGFSFGF